MNNTKYLLDGQEVQVIAVTDNGVIVSNIYEEYTHEEPIYDENVYLVKQVFDTPPHLKFEEKVTKLQECINALNIQKNELEKAINSSNKEHADKLKKFKTFEALQLLEDFIDGRITHYVMVQYRRVEILEFKNSKAEYSNNKFRLLSLYGNTEGNLEWNLSQYADGSGGKYLCIPHTSYEAAYAEAQRQVEILIQQHPNADIIKMAEKYEVEVAEDIKKKVIDTSIENLRNNIRSYQNQIDKWQEEITAKL